MVKRVRLTLMRSSFAAEDFLIYSKSKSNFAKALKVDLKEP
jgi:hypothetical protein